MNIKLRDSTPEDTNFILSTWLKSYNAHGNFHYRVPARTFFEYHQALIKKKLESCQVKIATTLDDETQIIGYIVYDPECVHYLYIKNLFRGFKIAKEMLSSTGAIEYSHHTSYSEKVTKGLTYNPYKFYN